MSYIPRSKHYYVGNGWCPVCDGHGGWDKYTNKARPRRPKDNTDTYMTCLWCSLSNTLERITK